MSEMFDIYINNEDETDKEKYMAGRETKEFFRESKSID
jgi:hypothetical protein